MIIECRECRAAIDTGDALPGAWVTCPKCHLATRVPQPEPAEAPAPADMLADLQAAAMGTPPTSPLAALAAPPSRAWAGPFISPGARATGAVLFLAVEILLACASLWSSNLQLEFLARARRIADTAERGVGLDRGIQEDLARQGEDNDTRERRVALAHMGGIVLSLLFFFLWTYRAYKNLGALGYRHTRFTPGGAVGWYFCPVVNLWKPFQAMQDIWRGSRSARGGEGLLGLWWTLWVIDIVVSQVSARVTMNAKTIEQFDLSTRLDIASSATGIASSALTLIVVLLVTLRQAQGPVTAPPPPLPLSPVR